MNKTDAAETLQKYVFDDEECIAQDMKDYNEALKMAIEALSAEVVRCKDCRHRVHDEERGLYYCGMYYGQGDVSDENFCQWGERSEE